MSGNTEPLELWAGVECTVNRIGDMYFDQLEFNGHARRVTDLDLFARLGIKAIRYPILWERTAPQGLDRANWTWADERLGRLRELGIQPIVGLVHHGSGPHDTSLIDPAFAPRLAEFAAAVAERYPWVQYYTPINEPLTTARFSGLYGLWYPHARDGLSFAHALLTQVRAVQLSMRAIRRHNPAAQLVQTEDMGKTFSTPALAYQAEFENTRRWISLDLLTGRVNDRHPMWRHLTWLGVREDELLPFLEEPCPPQIVGLNYYATSERFIDERLERYPEVTHGGNGRDRYADVEAVRVIDEGIVGLRGLLGEAWERYHLPLAVTEVHLGSTRDEQLRWIMEAWDQINSARAGGIDVRAMTAWSLLGAYNWNTLLTRDEEHYETGVFDVRSGEPRPTALAKVVTELAAGRRYDHPVLSTPGWWRRSTRLLYPPVSRNGGEPATSTPAANEALSKAQTVSANAASNTAPKTARPLLVTGATGTLGQAFERLCELRGLPVHLLTRQEMDIADPQSIERALAEHKPWAVVNAAGYVRVDEAEREPQQCRLANTTGPALLASACAEHGLALLSFSSDLVFDGSQSSPYVESNETAPLNVYGSSKAEAEVEILNRLPSALLVRTSAFFGPWDEHNFVIQALRALSAGRAFVAADDAVVSPTYVPDLVNASLDLLIDGEHGIWHIANGGEITWAEFALLAARAARVRSDSLQKRPLDELGYAAPRPRYSALGTERGLVLPPLEQAIARYNQERAIDY